MSFYPSASPCRSFQAALAPFLSDDGLPFADVLPAQQVQQACRDEGVDFGTSSRSVYTPAVTLWAFLSQVLGADRSCRAAALRVLVLVVALERGPCSADTGLYCRARAKLPVALLRRLTLEVADQMERAVPDRWRWRGRHVHLVDGTLVTAPDTPANQAAWPQPPTQRPGLGFPAMRLVVLLSLTTALVGGLALAPYEGKETGETALLRSLLDRLRPGDVVLADRHYGSYFLVVLLRQRGVDVVFRLHQCRDVDFRRGRRLGRDDHQGVWTRPACPEWMDPATYAVLPATLTVRELRTRVETPGLRVRQLVVVTTLLDAEEYRREAITDLYHQRWHAELDSAAIKVALRMEVLRCQTPAMVEKEIWTTMLGYHLVRKVSCQAALAAGKQPRQISFTATLQAVREAWASLTHGRSGARRVLGEALLVALGKEEVGDRPNRCEPRAIKRRPKNQALLMVPREQARAELLGR
jgi:Transposase DDE domain